MPRWILSILNCAPNRLNSVPQDLPQTHTATRRHCPQTMTLKGTGLPAPSPLPQPGLGPVSRVPPPTKAAAHANNCQVIGNFIAFKSHV